jgi:hypothetical protein
MSLLFEYTNTEEEKMTANSNRNAAPAADWKARVKFLVNRYASLKGVRYAVCWSRLWNELARAGLSVHSLARMSNGREETPSAVVERLGKWETAAKLAERLFR